MGFSLYDVIFNEKIQKKEIPSIPSPYRENILINIEKKLRVDPYKYGKPLCGKLKGKWSLRVGNYRVIYEILDYKVTVLIVAIGVRGRIYD